MKIRRLARLGEPGQNRPGSVQNSPFAQIASVWSAGVGMCEICPRALLGEEVIQGARGWASCTSSDTYLAPFLCRLLLCVFMLTSFVRVCRS